MGVRFSRESSPFADSRKALFRRELARDFLAATLLGLYVSAVEFWFAVAIASHLIRSLA